MPLLPGSSAKVSLPVGDCSYLLSARELIRLNTERGDNSTREGITDGKGVSKEQEDSIS